MLAPRMFLRAWAAAVMGWGAGGNLFAYVTLLNSGPAGNRVDMVFVGDGYTAAEVSSLYPQHVEAFVAHMFDQGQDPFPRYRKFFNVYRIDIVSNQSGADEPDLGIYRNTALDATFNYGGGGSRSLGINTVKAGAYISMELGAAGVTPEVRLGVVNTSRYGGNGGSLAAFSAGNVDGNEIGLHEMSHAFGGLADEYVSYATTYTGSEPTEGNVTKSAAGEKWARWLGYVDPAHPELGAVGAYEGAKYYAKGLYRPTLDSKMRTLNRPFDAVSREQLVLAIYRYVDPLDGWMNNAAPLTNPLSLWVDTVDPQVVKVQWTVDGVVLAGAVSETLDLTKVRLGVGSHTITALAYDDTDWVRLATDALRQSISWQVVIDRLLGDCNRDGEVNSLDIGAFISVITGNRPFMAEADINGDGLADARDVSAFLQMLNAMTVGSAIIPEPASAVMLLGWLLLRRR